MKKRLLLADDSVTIQKVVQITFSHDDYELIVVDNGDIAYEKARSQRPDLILADVFMPGKNGYELCAAVKNEPSLATVPVLLLTGTFEPFDEVKAKAVGADRWIAKPFESQALIACVEELLKLAAQAPTMVSPVAPPEPVYASVSAEVVGFAPPVLPTDLPDDMWGSEFSADSTIISSDRSGDDAFAAPNQDDLWDVTGFETEIPIANAADTDDLWGSFEPTLSAVETATPPVAAVAVDTWESDDFSSPFVDTADATVVSPPFTAETADIPVIEDIEILEEIDLLEPVADSPAEISLDNSFSPDDFSFAEESLPSPEAVETPVLVPPVPSPSMVITPPPLPAVDVASPATEVVVSTSAPTNAVALSDVQLELIVERVAGVVISRLAGTLLEKIAWEVVPDLAETMIKEELRKIRESVVAD